MTSSHEGPLCAALGHYVAGLTIAYCPHHMAWTVVARAGDEADDSAWRWDRTEFGPFDGLPDVLVHAQAEVQRLLRADRAAWEARRRAQAEGPAPTTEG